MQITAVQISINHFFHKGTPKSVSIRVAIIPQPFKLLEMNLNTLKIIACLWIPRFINIKINTCRALIEHQVLSLKLNLENLYTSQWLNVNINENPKFRHKIRLFFKYNRIRSKLFGYQADTSFPMLYFFGHREAEI